MKPWWEIGSGPLEDKAELKCTGIRSRIDKLAAKTTPTGDRMRNAASPEPLGSRGVK